MRSHQRSYCHPASTPKWWQSPHAGAWPTPTNAATNKRGSKGDLDYVEPELLVRAPNKVCSWGITMSKNPVRWTCLDLYVILDIFSRYVVG